MGQHKKKALWDAAIFVALTAGGLVSMTRGEESWTQLPPLPDREGFAGCFAGVSHGVLLVAGGANFPDKKPWEGGQKVWYDRIFVLTRPEGPWTIAATRLPRPLAYGASLSWREQLFCVGGSDAQRHYADAFTLEWVDGTVKIGSAPELPAALANGAYAANDDTLYIAGGQAKPDTTAAEKSFYALDMSSKTAPRWQALLAWPGPARIFPTVTVYEGAFYLFGGAELLPGDGGKSRRRYLRDSYRYRPSDGWKRLADLPTPLAGGASPAAVDHGSILLFGGDDGTQVGFTPPEGHPGFLKSLLRYEIAADRWTTAAMPVVRANAPVVRWRNAWVVVSGERIPGMRSPEVWMFQPKVDPAK